MHPSIAPASSLDLRRKVAIVAWTVIVVTVLFRAWASLRGWFYSDDFEFLTEAGGPISLGSLLAPHDSQLMPGGRLFAWVIASAGAYQWPVASLQLIALQALTSSMAWLSLRSLFGHTWAAVGLLTFFTWSALTLTSFMWWSSAINQLPFAFAFFLALFLHLRYLKQPRWAWAFLTMLAVILGLFFYVKSALIGPFLLLLSILYAFPTNGSFRVRALGFVRRNGHSIILLGGLTAVYAAYYTSHVPNPVSAKTAIDYGGLADALFRNSLGPTAVGGPWSWSLDNPPLGQVATPAWAATASWLLIAALAAVVAFRRGFDWRPILWLSLYLGVSFVLLSQGRAAELGGFAGLELRYLADAAPFLTFAIGLFAASNWLAPKPVIRPWVRLRPRLAITLVVALLLGGAWSSFRYATFWHSYPAKNYVTTVRNEASQRHLRLVDEPVPELVMSTTSYPSNLPSFLFAPIRDRVTATTSGNDLLMLSSTGTPAFAVVSPDARNAPGELPGCGYRVTDQRVDIQMEGHPDFFWWMQISYLADNSGSIKLSVGGRERTVPVLGGLHTYYLQGEGAISDLQVWSSSGGPILCLDKVEVGSISPLEDFQ